MNSTKNPIVSVIVPTRNSEEFIRPCLQSIANQTYSSIEIIVVDRNSTDNTKIIAQNFTDMVYNSGPERSAQRNFGARKAKGKYLAFIDSDMELSSGVIDACVKKMQLDDLAVAVTIPEESFGQGFWARCKQLERSFYNGIEWMEAARFMSRDLFNKVGGYSTELVSGEDWDLSQRISKHGQIKHVPNLIYHNEGELKLLKLLKKKYYYAQQFSKYMKANQKTHQAESQTSIAKRYKLFFSKPRILIRKPIVSLGMLYMKTCEFFFGGAGYLMNRTADNHDK